MKSELINLLQKEFEKESRVFDHEKLKDTLEIWTNYHNKIINGTLTLDDWTMVSELGKENIVHFLCKNKIVGSIDNFYTMFTLYAKDNHYQLCTKKNGKPKIIDRVEAEQYFKKKINPLMKSVVELFQAEPTDKMDELLSKTDFTGKMVLKKIIVLESLIGKDRQNSYSNFIPIYKVDILEGISKILQISYDKNKPLIMMKDIISWCYENLDIKRNPDSVIILQKILFEKFSKVPIIQSINLDIFDIDLCIKENGYFVQKAETEYNKGTPVYVWIAGIGLKYKGVIEEVDGDKSKTFNEDKYLKVPDNKSSKHTLLIRIEKIVDTPLQMKQIKENGFDIIVQGTKRFFDVLFAQYLENYFNEHGTNFVFNNTAQQYDNTIPIETNVTSYTGAYNKIFYGVPGCGKSYHIEHKVLDEIFQDCMDKKEKNIFRTIFYQDYSHADFVGQYMPKRINGQVEYTFVPKVFTKALKRAYQHPNEPVVLIIEEINRGDAASIFGDIFQLLDRDKDGKSEYEIDCDEIVDYLSDVENKNGTITNIVGENEKDGTNKIYIPSNLYLLATMNTCDQNVFALDTAFKRRWSMEEIPNRFEENDTSNYLKNMYVPYDFGNRDYITWENFVEVINEQIADKSDEFFGDDRQVGCYFVDNTCLLDDKIQNDEKSKNFAYKVISYLWNDVAKINRPEWFNDKIKTLHNALTGFTGENKDFKDLFNSGLKNNLIKKINNENSNNTPNQDEE